MQTFWPVLGSGLFFRRGPPKPPAGPDDTYRRNNKVKAKKGGKCWGGRSTTSHLFFLSCTSVKKTDLLTSQCAHEGISHNVHLFSPSLPFSLYIFPLLPSTGPSCSPAVSFPTPFFNCSVCVCVYTCGWASPLLLSSSLLNRLLKNPRGAATTTFFLTALQLPPKKLRRGLKQQEGPL